MTAALELWLERVRPRQEADRLVAEGKELMLLFARAASDAEEAELKARLMGAELKPWDPLEMKRLVWEARRESADAVARADTLFGDCEAAFESALSHLPEYRPAREGLADLYWIRFLQAEEARDPRWMRRWEELILRYAQERYARRLAGGGTLTLDTSPSGARVTLYPLQAEDGRSVPGPARELGRTPLLRVPAQMGSYEIRMLRPGAATLRFPLVLRRLQNLESSVRLPMASAVPTDAIPIPAGPALLGGDLAAISGLPEADVYVADFAIFRYPVTVQDYLRFLSDLQRRYPDRAGLRSPRARGSRGVRQEALFALSPEGAFELPFTDLDGTVWHADQPIVSISIDDARAYAAWLSAKHGVRYRLPTESEWEKAARGVDRRIFPWGNRFDASFCVMSESSPDPPDLPAIGAVPTDVSPYGVRDLGGGVRDWCEWDGEEASLNGRFPIRGGSYGTVEVYCRCASRSVVGQAYVGSHVGFRLVVDL
jgi:serine/threonine-protein kinase